jgi:LmbE family N-acetylglucosaminyl deacetylase
MGGMAAQRDDPRDILLRAESERVLVVAAHPDDETIGAGALLGRLRAVEVVFITDGAPRDGEDARARGFSGIESYAAARRLEAKDALGLAGVAPAATTWLDISDKEAVRHLAELARRLEAFIVARQPSVVIGHPYEGGHPDHDATAFAVQLGCRRIERAGGIAPRILEFGSYHADPAGSGAPRRLEFLPADVEVITRPLDEGERRRKAAMLACYRSQGELLREFPADVERFRAAPPYDFSRPPHAGQLLYETFGWGATGAAWRRAAIEALEELDQGPRPG